MPTRNIYRWVWRCSSCPKVAGSGATWLEAARKAVAHRRVCAQRRGHR